MLGFVSSAVIHHVMELLILISSLWLIDDRLNDKNKRYLLSLFLLIVFCVSISKHDSWYTTGLYPRIGAG